jgi:hypothetical protein
MGDNSLLIPALALFACILGCVTWPFIAIFIHEIGHAIAAKLVGLSPTRLIVGHPDESEPLFTFRWFRCSIECWPMPLGGATILAFNPTDRLKALIIAISGPACDALVILLCVSLWHHSFLRIALAPILVCQLINALRNLTPVSSLYDGVRVPNDGKIIIELFARKDRR